jgi:phenylacetaldehyde dehydrogenase
MNIAIAKPKLGKDSKALLAKKHHMLIDGKWVEAKSGKTFEVEDPATQESSRTSQRATRQISSLR